MHTHTHIQLLFHLIFPVTLSILFKQIMRELMKFCLYLGLKMVTQTIKNLPAMWETQFYPLVGKIPWRRAWQSTPVFLPGEFHGQRL